MLDLLGLISIVFVGIVVYNKFKEMKSNSTQGNNISKVFINNKSTKTLLDKQVFGGYISNPAKTYTFSVCGKKDLALTEISKIFVVNNTNLNGVSAICKIITDGTTVTHFWKIYSDDAHTDVLGVIAKQIVETY